MKRLLPLLGLVCLTGCTNKMITSINEEDGKYYMTVQQHGGVRGTIHGYVWVGTYDPATKMMHVHKLGEGSRKEQDPEEEGSSQ